MHEVRAGSLFTRAVKNSIRVKNPHAMTGPLGATLTWSGNPVPSGWATAPREQPGGSRRDAR